MVDGKRNCLTIEHVNAQSLLSCFEEIKILIQARDIDILCISETWLSSNIPSQYVNIGGYNLFRRDAISRGGGTCMYVRDNLNAVQLSFDLPAAEGIEDLWLRVQHRKLPSLIVGAMYRHPPAPVASFDYISEILQRVSLQNKSIFLLGDLNDDLLKSSAKLSKILKTAKFHQVIDRPTRITLTSKTLIDVGITNNLEIVNSTKVVPCHISDHELISVEVNLSKPKNKIEMKTFRSLKGYSKETFCSALLNATPVLNTMLDTDCVDKQSDVLTSTFVDCLDSCAPIITRKITRPPAPWMTEDIRNEMKNRNNLRRRRDLTFDEITNELYKISKKRVKSLIVQAKAAHSKARFEKCILDKENPWNVVRDIIPSKKVNVNVNVEDPLSTAEKFNSFFAEVGKNVFDEVCQRRDSVRRSPLLSENLSLSNPPFRPKPVSVELVIKTVLNIKTKNSYGSDGISSRFLKDSLPVLAFYLTVIINTSIVTGKVPIKWKHAIVSPLYKSGDQNDPSNYRPISLLCIMSKVLEKVVADQLYEYLSINRLLSNTQHGFRKQLSTETALNNMHEQLYENIDKNRISLLSLCDLSKAFDSVSHHILFEKMNSLNIDNFWFVNYLSDRTQSVKIQGHISTKKNVEYGVPQGSVIGPLLFNIYVNDLNSVSQDSKLVQFADDAQFLCTGTVDDLETLVRQAEATLGRAIQYFSENGLKINSSKTKCIFIGSRNYVDRIPDAIEIKVGLSSIKPSSTVNNLGVTMDSVLSFENHMEKICAKASGVLYFLNRNKGLMDDKTRRVVVESLAMSLFSYCSTIWGSCSRESLNKLQKIQNFAAKVADGGGRKFDRATPFIRKLGWLKINEQVNYDAIMFIYKMLKQDLPMPIVSLSRVSELRERNTRQGNNLVVPPTRTRIADRSIAVRGPMLWNKLPNVMKNMDRPSLFKKELKEHCRNS